MLNVSALFELKKFEMHWDALCHFASRQKLAGFFLVWSPVTCFLQSLIFHMLFKIGFSDPVDAFCSCTGCVTNLDALSISQLPATPSISQQGSQQRLKCLKLESIPCLTSGLRTTLNARKQRRGARLEVEQSACTYKYNVTVSRICVALWAHNLQKTVTTKAKWPATDERATTSFFEMPRYRLATSCDWLGRQSVHVVGRRVDPPSKCQTSLGWWSLLGLVQSTPWKLAHWTNCERILVSPFLFKKKQARESIPAWSAPANTLGKRKELSPNMLISSYFYAFL